MTDTLNGIESRHPITDAEAWIDNLEEDSRRALVALGELLVGAADRPRPETATAFTERCLGVDSSRKLIDEDIVLSGVQALTYALALAELITEHSAETGPSEHLDPPSWTQTPVGETVYHHPAALRASFPAGTMLPDVASVIQIRTKRAYGQDPEITVYVRREHQAQARNVLDRISERANELHPYRGRAVRACMRMGLVLEVITLPAGLTRDTVVVDESVWREIDLGLKAVRDQHEMLNRHGLGCRRGILLVGPPGTGKSALSAVVANEVVGAFTAIYVEARAGTNLLTAVIEEAQRFGGGPVLIVLEDVDLWCRDRSAGGGAGLSELLQAMDIQADARILTLASTNDSSTLDKAAIRTGRFDSIVEVGYPDRTAAEVILATLVSGIPGGDTVDTTTVAGRLPDRTSGSDLREIVRRAVLSGDGEVSTAALVAEIGSGRYRAQAPSGGQYL